jgi:hypothetical protein
MPVGHRVFVQRERPTEQATHGPNSDQGPTGPAVRGERTRHAGTTGGSA